MQMAEYLEQLELELQLKKEQKLSNFSVDFVGGAGVVRKSGTPDLTFDNTQVTGYLFRRPGMLVHLRDMDQANVVSGGFDYTVNFFNSSRSGNLCICKPHFQLY